MSSDYEVRCDRGPRQLAILALLAGVVGSGCAPPIDRGGDDAGDRAADQLGAIPQHPSAGACSGGRWSCYARIRTDGAGHVQPFASSTGFGPGDLASAYALDQTRGAGATIAIVDAYRYPAAESDLAAYRKKYGLPPCTKASGCLRIVNQQGKASPLPGTAPAGDDWTIEAALDLDAASAACPKCKLLLILADDDQGEGLYTANDTAAALGATVVSNSWGGPDDGSSPTLETHFEHAGVGYFVASGDNGNTGATPDYPSTSAHVTGVGGTSLVRSSSARGWTEGAWSGAGSSCSKTIAKPSFQAKAATGCSKRAAADVAAVADPNTGLAVYNAANGGWIVVGGTSAACPIVAAIYALTGHGASGPAYPYAHATSYFDVTTGKDGSCSKVLCHAGAGWDGPTGRGSPNGAALAHGAGKLDPSYSADDPRQGTGCTPDCGDKTCGDDGCGGSCGMCTGGNDGGGGTCVHPICSTGADLEASCDSCATSICAEDSFCCTTAWDAACVSEVSSICGQSCSAGACVHAECSTGTALEPGCSSCETTLCAQDSYCCSTSWDSTCVGEVGLLCGEACD